MKFVIRSAGSLNRKADRSNEFAFMSWMSGDDAADKTLES